MADFTSDFWHWFIVVITLVGIAALFWLNRWMTTPRRKKGETPPTTDHVWDGDLREYNHPLPRWWLNLFYISLVFGLVYIVLYPGLGRYAGVLGWTQVSQYQGELDRADGQFGPLYEQYLRQDVATLAGDAAAMKTGERLFINYCAACHGSDARGAAGYPNLRDRDWLWGGDPAAIEKSILEGRTGAMPAWGAALGREGVFDVAEYVLSLSGKRRVNELAAERGREKFAQLCAVCHGAQAKGNPAFGAPNLTDDVWLYGSSQQTIMDTIERGRSGRMPAHRDFLGEAKVHVLAAYVYGLSQERP